MSVMVRTHSNCDVLDNIFIFYNFQQVSDVIMIVAFVERLNRWEKIFIYNSADGWDIKSLATYFNEKKVNWICNKLNMIFQHRENSNQFDGIDIQKAINENANFFLGLNQID